MPPLVFDAFRATIISFIQKYLTLPLHSSIKAILLAFLIRSQFEKDGSFDAKHLIEYLRIPKESDYNQTIVSIYRYCHQKFEKQAADPADVILDNGTTTTGEPQTTSDGTSEKQKVKPVMIGFGDFITNFESFGPFGRFGRDTTFVRDAVNYFFH
ncbi:hypothetical protein RFI_30519, partial [Reticulomyxa filosa]